MATREFSREKNMDVKPMQVNLRKSVSRMTKRGDIRTDQIGR